jgi:hypothetical protein
LLPRAVPSPAKASTVLAKCQAGLAANPNEIGSDYGLLKRALGGVTKEVLGVVDKVLDAVERDLPSVDEAFLKQVELVPGYQSKVLSIRQQRQAFLQGRTRGSRPKPSRNSSTGGQNCEPWQTI